MFTKFVRWMAICQCCGKNGPSGKTQGEARVLAEALEWKEYSPMQTMQAVSIWHCPECRGVEAERQAAKEEGYAQEIANLELSNRASQGEEL